MDETKLEELENPENWDWDKAKRKPGKKDRRTIVSVGFHRDDFEKVAQLAEELGYNVSSFIRAIAIERVARVALESNRHGLAFADPVTSAIQPIPTTSVQWFTTPTPGGLLAPNVTATQAPPSRVLIPG